MLSVRCTDPLFGDNPEAPLKGELVNNGFWGPEGASNNWVSSLSNGPLRPQSPLLTGVPRYRMLWEGWTTQGHDVIFRGLKEA